MNAPPFKSNLKFLANKHTRLLIKESQAIFMDAAEMSKTQLVNISRRYRSVVHECVMNLNRDIYHRYEDECEMFREIEIIWNLCEILMLDIHPTGILITQLTNCIKWHFDDIGWSEGAKAILVSLDDGTLTINNENKDDNSEFLLEFWDCVKKLVLRGELKKAVRLLRCYCTQYKQSDLILTTIELLEKMPLSNQYLLHEFFMKWKQWSDECRCVRDGVEQFCENPHITDILRILAPISITCRNQDQHQAQLELCTGDYANVGHLFDNWYQLLVTILLYTDPCVKDHDLSDLCRLCIDLFRNFQGQSLDQELSGFDEILISAFECDLIQVIRHCCAYLQDNWWFVTHFVDLLHQADHLKRHEIQEPERLREFFLVDYAKTLFDHDSLWTIGVSYLDHCPLTGFNLLEAQLGRVPIDMGDDDKAHKLIGIAQKRGYHALVKSICTVISRLWINRNRRLVFDSHDANDALDLEFFDTKDTGTCQVPQVSYQAKDLPIALHWAVAGVNGPLCTYIADRYLHHYSLHRQFPDSDTISNLGPSMLISERLTFLSKYYEFTQSISAADIAESVAESQQNKLNAAKLLVSLITSKIAPKFFIQVLLSDALSLIDQPEVIFNVEQTMSLMRIFEEISKPSLHASQNGATNNSVNKRRHYANNTDETQQNQYEQILRELFPKLGHCIVRNLIGLEHRS